MRQVIDHCLRAVRWAVHAQLTPMVVDAVLLGMLITLAIDAWGFHIDHRHFGSGCGNGQGLLWLPSTSTGVWATMTSAVFVLLGLWFGRRRKWAVWSKYAAALFVGYLACSLFFPRM